MDGKVEASGSPRKVAEAAETEGQVLRVALSLEIHEEEAGEVVVAAASSLDQQSTVSLEVLDDDDGIVLFQTPQTHGLFHPFVPSFLAHLS